MNDAATLPPHMRDISELTAEAFAPYDQVIVSLRTSGQSAETSYDPDGRRIRVLWDGPSKWGLAVWSSGTRGAMTLLE